MVRSKAHEIAAHVIQYSNKLAKKICKIRVRNVIKTEVIIHTSMQDTRKKYFNFHFCVLS